MLVIILIVFAIVLLSLSCHEFAHAYTANFFGDSTARNQGRMTLNPFKHIDPFGTILLPMLLLLGSSALGGLVPVFGYARPVPVDFQRLRPQKLGITLVAAAGPLANLGIAMIAGMFVDPHAMGMTVMSLVFSINFLLAMFNLLPVPPLDGSRIVSALLPDSLARSYNRFSLVGFILLLVFIQSPHFSHFLGSGARNFLLWLHA